MAGVKRDKGRYKYECKQSATYLAVTFERKRVLPRYFGKVVDADTALDAANGKACRIRKTRDAPSLELEGRLLANVLRRLSRAIVRNHVPTCRRNDQQVVADVHVVHALWEVNDA